MPKQPIFLTVKYGFHLLNGCHFSHASQTNLSGLLSPSPTASSALPLSLLDLQPTCAAEDVVCQNGSSREEQGSCSPAH